MSPLHKQGAVSGPLLAASQKPLRWMEVDTVNIAYPFVVSLLREGTLRRDTPFEGILPWCAYKNQLSYRYASLRLAALSV